MHVTSTFRTLLLVAVAVMAAKASDKPAGPPAKSGLGVTATRFVCAHCTATGQLSSRGLFHNRAAVRRHIAASKSCRAADMGIREIQVEARPGDVMAGGGGTAGPAQEIRHQPPGDAPLKQSTVTYHKKPMQNTDALMLLAKR